MVCGRLSGWARVATKGVRALCGGRQCWGNRLHGLDCLSVGEGGCSPSQSRELTCENPSRCHSVVSGTGQGQVGGGTGHITRRVVTHSRSPCAPSSSSLTCSFILEEYRSGVGGHTFKCSERSLMALPRTHIPEWAQVAKVRGARSVWSGAGVWPGDHPAGMGETTPFSYTRNEG